MKRSSPPAGTRLLKTQVGAKTFGLVVGSLVACVAAYLGYELWQPVPGPELPSGFCHLPYAGEPVPLNTDQEIQEGFHGDVHPLLHGKTQLELTARWEADERERFADQTLAFDRYYFFLDMKPEIPQRTYTERDFSAFLPQKLTGVGQVWSLDQKKVRELLEQFHHAPSLHLDADGRRVGPDGAFAVLRVVSPTHLEIDFRVHAEFDVTSEVQDNLPAGRAPVQQAWYTPAYFTGQMLVNRERGTVEYFRLKVPTDQTFNAHLTVKNVANFRSLSHFMARVARMDLKGGDHDLAAADPDRGQSITRAEADRALKRIFYKFVDIEFLPFDKVLATAKNQNKPILAVVLWGNLDDQSC
jgi:hypothetical protein